MNNRERVFCSVVKVIYEKYKTYGVFDFNSILFTYAELEDAFNSLHFGKEFRRSLFTNYYYGHGSKNEKIKFFVNGFEEESMELYRLAYPKEHDLYTEVLNVSKRGWEYLNEYDKEKLVQFIKKYSSWIKKHKAEKNVVAGLSITETAWVSAALLTYNTYYHDTDKCELKDLFFATSRITNLAFVLNGDYSKKAYSNAVRNKTMKLTENNTFLSSCPGSNRRITFRREAKEWAPKISDTAKLTTVNGKKTIKAIKKAIADMGLYYYPTEDEYEVLKACGLANNAHIYVEGNFVKRDREALVRFILRRHCYSRPCQYDYFQKYYNYALDRAGVINDKSLLLEPDYAKQLINRKDVICSSEDCFRYFWHSELYVKREIASLNLDRYMNKEISAALIYRNIGESLRSVDLKNADEVYDFIKKYVDKDEYRISLLGANEISFGESNVKNQLLEVISRYSPLEKPVLIVLYAREYGSSKEFIESQLPSISDHYDGRRYWSGIPKKENEPILPGRVTRSILAQFQDGDKEIRRRPPDIKRMENVLSKMAPEDTEWGRLRNRIIREFFDAELVSEIELSDEDFFLLKERYFNPRCRQIAVRNDVSNGTDILLTVGMVNVAIRKYDGSLWPNVAETIGVTKLTTVQQAKIGNVIYRTLMKYGKAYVDVNENLRNVLMHAFITDSFAADFFKYLFQFYNLDLDRNISDTCDEEADYICEAIKNPHSKRQQMLSEYSGLSIYAAYDYCKGVIAAALKAIDNAFWGASNDVSGLPTRLYEKLIEWKNNEKGDFRKEKTREVATYKKYFNTPLLICETRGDVSFSIVLPRQLVQSSDNNNRHIKWRVKRGTDIKEYYCRLSEGNFGLKTDEITVAIKPENVFDKYTFELLDDQIAIKTFTWEEKRLCVFDNNGYFESLTSLNAGEYIGFATKGRKVESTAIEDSYDIPGMTYYQFVFKDGDILSVSEDANYYIGDIPQRGFSRDGLLDAVSVYDDDDNKLPLYAKIPALIIDIENEKLEGTAITINGKKYRASDLKPIDIKNGRLLDQNFYFFNLSDVKGIINGYNRVDIDIPGTSRGKSLEFIYVEDFDFGFEDAPYIYKTRGTLRINYHFEKKTISDTKAKDYEYFDFEFADLEDNVLNCPLRVAGVTYTISFEVPLFLYSLDRIEWSYYKPDDYWHSELPITIYLKYPSKTIKLELAEDNGDTISFKYDRRTDGTFECDLTKVKSYIGPFHTKKMLHTIHLQDGAEKYDLLRVINHSVFLNVELTADIDDNKIFANFDVLGKGEYFADIRQGGDLVCEKAALDANNHLEIETQIKTGEYEVALYEGESDEDSFDLDIQYHFAGKLIRKLRNPADIAGERIILRSLQYVVDSKNVRSLSVSEKYINYINIENKVDKHSYEGTLIVAFHGGDIRDVKNVRITIPDFNRTNVVLVNFIDEYDEPDNLLYDSYSECVATPEYSTQCNKNERYRRYDPVLWTDEEESYYWNVEYVKRDAKLERAAKEWIKTEHYKTSSDSIWKN